LSIEIIKIIKRIMSIRNFLKNNPKIAEEIDRRIRAALGVVEQDAPEGKINPETGEVEVAS